MAASYYVNRRWETLRSERCCDIIQRFHERRLDHILELIWLPLDVQSLMNAQLVSKCWRSAVNTGKMRFKMLKTRTWDQNLEVCTYVRKKSDLPFVSNLAKMAVNDTYIAILQWNGDLVIWNRLTLSVFKCIRNVSPDDQFFMLRRVQMDENDTLVGTSINMIYIFDIKSGRLTKHFTVDNGIILKFGWKNNLLLVQTKPSLLPFEAANLTVYRVTNQSNVQMMFRRELPPGYLIQQFVIDETYLVLLFGDESCNRAQNMVLMCSKSLKILRSLPLTFVASQDTLCCANGWIVLTCDNGYIRFFDVATLTCRYTFRGQFYFKIDNLKINGHFLISSHGDREIAIWDFRAICSGNHHKTDKINLIKLGSIVYSRVEHISRTQLANYTGRIKGLEMLTILDLLDYPPIK